MFSILTGITLIVFYSHFARLSDIGGLKNTAAPKKLIYKAKIRLATARSSRVVVFCSAPVYQPLNLV